ncbi:MAG: hypothetical protein ACHRHE_10760 [Tepidisphaerales bacterium]
MTDKNGWMTGKNVCPTSPVAAEIVFIDEVRRRLDGRVLRYSCREELLRRAAELGIARFEANLLIATAQHQASCDTGSPLPRQRRRPPTFALAVAVLVLQSIVMLGLWVILR